MNHFEWCEQKDTAVVWGIRDATYDEIMDFEYVDDVDELEVGECQDCGAISLRITE